jgi:hypothetical protein
MTMMVSRLAFEFSVIGPFWPYRAVVLNVFDEEL